MIGYLQGTLLRSDPERLLLDVQGVGYEVNVPLSTWYEIEKRREAPIGLFIHTHMREDGIALFGFWTEREKALFEKLIGVNGIGPRLARVILSGMAPDDLMGAIANGDLGRLGTIPGVGKKTAERIVLELKDRLPRLQPTLASTGAAAADAPALRDDVLSALMNLGYHRPLGEKAVDAAIRTIPDGDFERTLRQALRELAR
jgi:Holliday junction DNA helicase RuvA